MAVKKKKKPAKKIRFQLTRSGIVGIGAVCFCIFLWMFLLGVWAGQSLLKSSATVRSTYEKKSDPDKQPVTFLRAQKKKKPKE